MNIQTLTSGLILKNYKDLCATLDIKPSSSNNSRKAQYKELERYCTYTKQGQKIIINEIFAEPLPKLDHRKDLDKEGNNSKYVDNIKYLILNTLSETEGHKYTLTKDRLFALLGMVNQQYLHKEIIKKVLPKKDDRIGQYEINHFYLRVNNRLTKILFDSLTSLKRRFLIDYREVTMVVRLDQKGIEQHTEATENEIVLITGVKYNVLAEMNLNSIMHVMFKFKTEEFYNRVSEILKNNYGIEYSYNVIELLYKKENVLKELTILEKKRHRKELNNKVIETINNHSQNTYDKNIKEYNEGLEDFLYNDKPMFGKWNESQFKGFKHKLDYVDIQKELAEYLLRIDD